MLECDPARDATVTLRFQKRVLSGATWCGRIPAGAVDIEDEDMRDRVYDAWLAPPPLETVATRSVRAETWHVPGARRRHAVVASLEQFPGESGDRAPVGVRLFARRGQRDAVAAVTEVLRRHVGIAARPDPALASALDVASAVLPDGFGTAPAALSPDLSIDAAVRRLVAGNLHTLRSREPGIIADLDIEFLHDYRIALRRMRSIVSGFDTVFDAQAATTLNSTLKWLNGATGPRRDLDVYLAHFPELVAFVSPENLTALESMRMRLLEERDTRHRELIRTLGGARYRRFIDDTEAVITAVSGSRCDAPGSATRAAADCVWKSYRRVLRRSKRSGLSEHIDELHTLRKDCKRLRYRIEAFASLFDRSELAAAISELKQLQDVLGAVCDVSVQRQFIADREAQLARQAPDPARFEAMIVTLEAGYAAEETALRRRVDACVKRFRRKAVKRVFRRLFSSAA